MRYGEWIGRVTLALIFLCNAVGVALVIGWHERLAALFLALFLIPATLAAHDFWAYHGPELQGQLANFLKNVAMFGGLCFVTFRLGPGSVMRAARNHSTAGAPGRSLPV